jgi:hypothetical protein
VGHLSGNADNEDKKMATEHLFNMADADERMVRVFKLICVGGLTSLLTVGCANMKTDGGEGDAVAVAQPAPAVRQSVPPSVQAPAQKAAPAVAASTAEQDADALVASLAKPASEIPPVPQTKPVPQVMPVPTPAPVVKVEPKPVPKPVIKVEPKPVPVPAPVVKVEPAPVPVPVPVAPVVKVEPVPVPAPVVTPEPKPEVAETAAPVMMPSVDLASATDLVSGDANLSASASKELPIRFELWRIDKGKGPYDASAVLITPTFQLGNDRAAAQLYVTVMADKILVTSTSDIAAKKGLSGIRIDDGGWLPFTDVTSDNVGVVRGNWLDKLENGSKLSIRMGLFPDMSKNPEQFEAEVSLNDMRTAIPRYKKLLK